VKSIELTKEEKILLRTHFRNAKCALIRERAHAIILFADQERTAKDISLILMRHIDTIYKWINLFNKKRIASIFHEYKDNENASKLTKEQKEEIKKVLSKPPSNHGIPGNFWTLPRFKEYINAQFGVFYESDRSYHYLLKYSNFSWKLPALFDIKRDD